MDRRELSRRFVRLFSVDILVKGSRFLLLPIYLNLMTQEEFGLYSYALSIVSMLTFVLGMGQHASLNRFYHSEEYDRESVFENIHLVLLTSYLTTGLFLLFFRDMFTGLFFEGEIAPTIYYLILSLSIMGSANQLLMAYLYQAEKISLVQKKNIFDMVVSNTLAISMLYLLSGPKDETRLLATAIAVFVSLCIFYPKFISLKSMRFRNRSMEIYKRIIFNGAPMAVGSFANFFIVFGDRFSIEKLLDKSSLGIFSFAMTMVAILMMVFYTFQNVWRPYLFKEKNLDISFSRVYKITAGAFILSIVIGGLLYAIVYILTGSFIEHSYIESLDFLWILVLASFFQMGSMLLGGFYQIFEINYISTPVNIAGGVLNIYLNYYFIDIYGLTGAAISTLIISVILYMTHFFVVHRYKKRGEFGEYYSNG